MKKSVYASFEFSASDQYFREKVQEGLQIIQADEIVKAAYKVDHILKKVFTSSIIPEIINLAIYKVKMPENEKIEVLVAALKRILQDGSSTEQFEQRMKAEFQTLKDLSKFISLGEGDFSSIKNSLDSRLNEILSSGLSQIYKSQKIDDIKSDLAPFYQSNLNEDYNSIWFVNYKSLSLLNGDLKVVYDFKEQIKKISKQHRQINIQLFRTGFNDFKKAIFESQKRSWPQQKSDRVANVVEKGQLHDQRKVVEADLSLKTQASRDETAIHFFQPGEKQQILQALKCTTRSIPITQVLTENWESPIKICSQKADYYCQECFNLLCRECSDKHKNICLNPKIQLTYDMFGQLQKDIKEISQELITNGHIQKDCMAELRTRVDNIKSQKSFQGQEFFYIYLCLKKLRFASEIKIRPDEIIEVNIVQPLREMRCFFQKCTSCKENNFALWSIDQDKLICERCDDERSQQLDLKKSNGVQEYIKFENQRYWLNKYEQWFSNYAKVINIYLKQLIIVFKLPEEVKEISANLMFKFLRKLRGNNQEYRPKLPVECIVINRMILHTRFVQQLMSKFMVSSSKSRFLRLVGSEKTQKSPESKKFGFQFKFNKEIELIGITICQKYTESVQLTLQVKFDYEIVYQEEISKQLEDPCQSPILILFTNPLKLPNGKTLSIQLDYDINQLVAFNRSQEPQYLFERGFEEIRPTEMRDYLPDVSIIRELIVRAEGNIVND